MILRAKAMAEGKDQNEVLYDFGLADAPPDYEE
jgi:hypothetical protein